MNKIIYKPVLIVVIILSMNALTRLFFKDYSWGNEPFQTKRHWLLTHREKYNTLFLGSSLTLDHVIPSQFDSIAQGGIKSFNMGIVYLTNPESYYLAEKMLEKDSVKMSFAFMELHELVELYNNWYTLVRFYYWMNGNMYRFAFSSLLEEDISFHTLNELKKFSLHHLEYVLNVDMTYKYLSRQMKPQAAHKKVKRDGFNPLRYMNEADIKRCAEKIATLEIKCREMYQKGPSDKGPNRTQLKMALEMIQHFSDHGIHLIFILNPRQNPEKLPGKLALFNSLPAQNRIDLADAVRYPELFTLENSSNITHFNPTGAAVYTAVLASSFNELVMKYSLELPGIEDGK